MSRTRVIQISDTHLADEPTFPLLNWRKLVVHIRERDPDLVIHTGDVTLDGVRVPKQLDQAKALHTDFAAPSLVVPGNHDVGELPAAAGLEPEVTEAACQRFIERFGQDRFARDIDGWRLIGVNALLFGSGLAAEQAQWQFVERAFAGAQGRHVALFCHKPLYRDGHRDGSKPPNMLPATSVDRLHALMQNSGGKLIASGHLHEHRVERIAGVQNVWAPSTSFVIDDELTRPTGTRRVGFVEYVFDPDDVSIEIVCPDDMTSHLFLQEPGLYPEHQAAARASIEKRRQAP